MKIFVTGATGVLGRPTIKCLIQEGHEVRGLARSDANMALLHNVGAESVQADLFDLASLKEALAGCEAILHLATKIPPTRTIRRLSSWAETDRIRRQGTHYLVEAAQTLGVRTIVYPSVCFVYPDCGAEWINATNRKPVSEAYYRSTLDAETAIERFTRSGGCGIALRMGFFYGPESFQSREQMMYARWGISTSPGPADVYHPAIWIEDAARAVVAALSDVPAGTYDVVDDEPLTTRQLNQALANAVGRRNLMQLPYVVYRWNVGDVLTQVLSRSRRVSNRRFKEATGWGPLVTNASIGWKLIAHTLAMKPGKEHS
jgi:nucleoside-diphosphate-sugar epimerase